MNYLRPYARESVAAGTDRSAAGVAVALVTRGPSLVHMKNRQAGDGPLFAARESRGATDEKADSDGDCGAVSRVEDANGGADPATRLSMSSQWPISLQRDSEQTMRKY